MRYWGELFILTTIIVLGMLALYSSNDITNIVPGAPKHPSATLEHVHAQKHALANSHIALDTKVVEPIKNPVPIVKRPKRLFVLTTGERAFKNPSVFSVNLVHGTKQAGVFAATFDEGFGPKDWPEGAKRVAEGHVTIWKRVAAECSGWCFVSEDDAIWPDALLPAMPPHGFVSYFVDAVCDAATRPYSGDYRQVVKAVVRGRCMPYGAVAYALTQSFAKTILHALPMDKPVDHFLWEQAVKHEMGFVTRDFMVKHASGKSLRETVVNRESTSIEAVKVRQKLKPIHISSGTRRVKCDVPCYWPKNWGGVVNTLTIDELGVQLTMSIKGEQNHPSLELSAKSNTHIFATTRFDSEIPMPYYEWPWTMYLTPKPKGPDIWSKNGIQTPHVPWESVSKAGVFIARNCNSKSGREKLVKELMNLLPVSSVSSCLNNVRLPSAQLSDKRKLMRLYAFYFAFENEITLDYITEKLWTTFGAGVLPVYFGAPNIKDHVPEHSIVNVADYDTVADLANHLKEILENKDLYDSYHEWRYKPLPYFFVRKYNFTHVHSECRTCRWASAKLNGLKWDAEQQVVLYSSVNNDQTLVDSAKEDNPLDENDKIKYVVVMPSMKRNDDEYLKQTLASLHEAKPSLVPVILVNANQPPEEHAYLIHWCNSHQSYKCMTPPKVSESLVRQTIREDKRGDSADYLRWRTNENAHAYFGLLAFLNTSATHLIWLEDDVTVAPTLFESLKDMEIACLRASGHCGSVGYLMRRSFVHKLVLAVQKQMRLNPFDWIIESVDSYSREARIPSVYHHGKKSSNGKIRPYTAVEKQFFASLEKKVVVPTIAVAVPTYNRAGYVKLCAQAIKNTISKRNIHVFDDFSSDFGISELRSWFGTSNVRRNAERLKADRQARQIMEWFVETDYDWLVTLDSDLIVRPDWLDKMRAVLTRVPGVVSLYHSGNANHPTGYCEHDLCEMQSLGNAGIVWSRPLATKMLSEMSNRDGFDWGWTEWLKKQGIKQYAIEKSLVLHVGMHGTWGADSKREKSQGFDMSTLGDTIKVKAEKYLSGTLPKRRMA